MTRWQLPAASVVTLSTGNRHGFGPFLQPITMDRSRKRETSAIAQAMQNLARGPAKRMWSGS